MEQVLISRLSLVNSQTINIGDPWPSEVLVPDEHGQPKKVGQAATVCAIFFVQSVTKSESWSQKEVLLEEEGWVEEAEAKEIKDAKPLDARMVTYTKSTQTPAHYEVWAEPKTDSLLAKTNETRCLRIPRELVLESEEAWPFAHAYKLMKVRAWDTELISEEDEPEEPRTNGAAASA